MGISNAYQLNDKTIKYKAMTQSKRLHEYLGLPGEFKLRYPQEVVFPKMDSGRMDELYLTTSDILINLEEESGDITKTTLEKFAKYALFARYMYNKKVHVAVICHKNPGKEFEYFKDSSSIYIKVHYIYFSQDELWAKYEKLISKVKQKVELTEKEALDMAFVCKFIDKKHKYFVIDSLTDIFEDAIIQDKKLKRDVAVIMEAMIVKHISSEVKQKEFAERINMTEYDNEMQKIIYEEFGDELYEKDAIIEQKENEIKSQKKEISSQKFELENKDRTIETKDEEISSQKEEISSQKEEISSQKKEINKLSNVNARYKSKIHQLANIKDFNSPEAKKIIETLIVMK